MSEIPADRQRWQRIEALLDGALDLEGEELPAFLDRACEGDGELRPQVEALLEADERSEDFLESSASGYAATLLDEIPQPADSRKCRASSAHARISQYYAKRSIHWK